MKTATLPLRTFLCTLAVVPLSSALHAQTTQSPAALPDAPSAVAQVAPPAVPTGPTVLFDTSMGRLTCKLFSKDGYEAVHRPGDEGAWQGAVL
jgi:peptidyl-prolyl cis-trans isomerase A (cyclophilin A)